MVRNLECGGHRHVVQPLALGQILVFEKVITSEQLDHVLKNQKLFSGRLGTHLVEQGLVDVDRLETILSKQFGVPIVQDRELEGMPSQCNYLFPIEALQRFQMIPFRKKNGRIYVAMTNPRDAQALQWLYQVTSNRFVIHSISEIKYHYFLFRHFRGESDRRIRNIFLNYRKDRCRQKMSQQPDQNIKPKPAFFRDINALEDLGLKPLEDHEELSSEQDQEWVLFNVNPVMSLEEKQNEMEYHPEFADFTDF